jgi:hypothetical protein
VVAGVWLTSGLNSRARQTSTNSSSGMAGAMPAGHMAPCDNLSEQSPVEFKPELARTRKLAYRLRGSSTRAWRRYVSPGGAIHRHSPTSPSV